MWQNVGRSIYNQLVYSCFEKALVERGLYKSKHSQDQSAWLAGDSISHLRAEPGPFSYPFYHLLHCAIASTDSLVEFVDQSPELQQTYMKAPFQLWKQKR